MEEYEQGNYHYCPVCWRAEPEVEFNPDSYDWQYTQRCIDCERNYVQDFKDKYPDTKSKKRFKKMTDEDRERFNEMMQLERYFGDNHENF